MELSQRECKPPTCTDDFEDSYSLSEALQGAKNITYKAIDDTPGVSFDKHDGKSGYLLL